MFIRLLVKLFEILYIPPVLEFPGLNSVERICWILDMQPIFFCPTVAEKVYCMVLCSSREKFECGPRECKEGCNLAPEQQWVINQKETIII